MPKTGVMSEKRYLRLRAAIDRGRDKTSLDCKLLEISDSIALIEVQAPEMVPDDFILVLSDNARVRRRCTVIKRGSNRIDVTIVNE
jgi:hypothetical protein